jgi:hypothetical protein
MSDRAEAEERAVMLDRRGRIAPFIGDNRQVVVRTGTVRIDRQGAAQQISGVGRTTLRAPHERQVHERLHVARIGSERHAELGRRLVEATGPQERDAEVVVSFHVGRIERDRALELLDRIIELIAVLVEQPEIVVYLGVLVVPLQKRAVLHHRAVVVTDALMVERKVEEIIGRLR